MSSTVGDKTNLVSSGAVKKAVGHVYSLIACSNVIGKVKRSTPKALNEAPQASTIVCKGRWSIITDGA